MTLGSLGTQTTMLPSCGVTLLLWSAAEPNLGPSLIVEHSLWLAQAWSPAIDPAQLQSITCSPTC